MAVSDKVMRHLHNSSGNKAAGGAEHDDSGHGRRAEATFLPEPEPRDRHYTIISVDDHLIEPADVFEGRVPAEMADHAPRVITLEEGSNSSLKTTAKAQRRPRIPLPPAVQIPKAIAPRAA